MKKRYLFLCLLLLFIFLIPLSCAYIGNDIAGLYVDPNNERNFVKINSNGTYYTVLGIEGEWERHGDEITFITPMGIATFKIEGNKLISPKQVYIKKE